MTVLITGGCGFIGSHIVKALTRQGKKVVAFDKSVRTADEVAGPELAHLVTIAEGDVTDSAAIATIIRQNQVTEVVHAAAVVGVAASAVGPSHAVRININGALAVFDAIVETGSVRRLVDLSSEEVYGHFTQNPITEDATRAPISPYGISKLAVEQLGTYYADHHDLPYVAARLCWVFGPGFPRNRVPNSWLEDAAAGVKSDMPRGGDQLIDFTHIDDALDGVLALLEAPQLRHRAYNVATGRSVTVRQLSDIIREQNPGWQVKLGAGALELAPGVLAAHKGAMDCDRIYSEIGWQAKTSLEEGLAETTTAILASRSEQVVS
ncbi:nucleoside-diphosphate-sugar epimerase [Arthrobacter sp. 1088]|uniref:NAD-dependent epimerase/dehydratase family protein n=1 Tax=Arthrobacter sp. 1088 TaxID=2817768 RepID=UPI00285458EC|nr:NAD(P)-dependent oxidoreductase [Arthrobacter sp. 1088]MDR6688639.1 nucleoside-diphosphate-sugar epimerase [Arthrobacter sp. 1088]